jgi:hypothetical protein
MAATQTPAAASAAGQAVTRPIYLIQIGAGASPSRLTTGQAIVWRGVSWSAGSSVEVSGLSANGGAGQSGQIRLGNARLDWGALVLGDVRDTPVKVWAGDAGAIGDDDLRLVFDGAIDAAEVSDQHATLTLAPSTTRAQFAPRRIIGPETGLTVLLPAGSRVPVGGQVYVIER